ncbi:uncharacterized protein HO173_010079 [Neofusicoccum parvum]|nr:uncharacterized protein HO173_010079 [Neofusicoccum parvum]
MRQLSPSTGEAMQYGSGKALLEQVIHDILSEPVRWDILQGSLSRFLDHPVLGFGDRSATAGIATSLQAATGKRVDVVDPASKREKVPGGFDGQRIAVVGMSGRFPGASDIDELWELLASGRDVHKEIPKDRFDVATHFDPAGKKTNTSHSRYGCFIEQPGLFDARFFHMSPREATQTDPMHRLALVTAYEALEMSGFVLNSTPSTRSDRVGTFYGQTSDDWREVNAAQDIGTYFIPGGVRAFAPGRISYHFGFSGPSYSVDTACSSSLAAIQVACSSLKMGECDTAVAGGLNVLTAPDIFAGLSRGQFLSKTGPCKTWDAGADGYCRADGVGTVVLKRLDDAVADKDRIYGVILAAATNHSADAISITHPHAGNQAQLYESILHSADADPMDVSYVEMHGTGTQAGDLAETQSVANVFAPVGARGDLQALHIGAIKSNIGHSEAAAGVSALIKVLLMLQKSSIPPHVGIKSQLNPALPDFKARRVNIAFKSQPWLPRAGKPRMAFLNNFSAAGGNTAMLIQEHAHHSGPNGTDPRSSLPFVVSARSLQSLRKNILRLLQFLEKSPEASMGSLSYTLTARRTSHNYRVGFAASSTDDLRKGLLAQAEVTGLSPVPSRPPRVAFAYTGQGAFYVNLARDLLKQSNVFSNALKHYDYLATSMGFPSIVPVIDASVDGESDPPPSVAQVATTCVQMALTRLWESWGVRPASVIGHSLGEYGALNAAGVLSDAETIYLVARRAQLLEEKCGAGTHAMLAVKASVAEIEAATHGHGFAYDIACINSAKDTVLASRLDQIHGLSDLLQQALYKCVTLNLPYAYHSAQLDPVLDEFEDLARGVVFNKPTIPVLSPLLARPIEGDSILTPEYLRRHAREPVDFAGALQKATDAGLIDANTVFVEVGPHPVCSKMIKAHFGVHAVALPSLHRDRSPWEVLSGTACALHCGGVGVDWRQFHRDFEPCHELLRLPAYSFEEKNYWIDYVNDWCLHKAEPRSALPDAAAPAVAADAPRALSSSVHRIVFEKFQDDGATVVAQTDLSTPEMRAAVLGHMVNDAGLCPSSLYADIAYTLGDYIAKLSRPGADVGLNCGQMEVVKPLILKENGPAQTLQISITADAGMNVAAIRYSSVNSAGKEIALHAECTLAFEDKAKWVDEWASNSYLIHGRIDQLKEMVSRGRADQVSRRMAYKLFSSLVSYDPKYQGMEEVVFDSANFEATARVAFQTKESDGRFLVNPFWIDSVAHLSGFILNGSDATDSKNFVYISHGWGSMRLARPLKQAAIYTSYVKMRPAENNTMAGDVYVIEEDEIIGVFRALKFQRIPRKVLNTLLPPNASASASPKAIPAESQTQKREHVNANAARPSQLQDLCEWESLGVDSLLSLQITGRLREALDIDLPSSIFLTTPTVGEFKKHLSGLAVGRSGSTSSSSSDSSDSDESDTRSDTSVETAAIPTPGPAAGSAPEIMTQIRGTISEQMGIPVEEISESADLVSLGVDSLMGICILGALRETAGLSLPSTLFQECHTIEAIAKFLDLNTTPARPNPTLPQPPREVSSGASAPPQKHHRATSVLLQGTRHATKKLFLFPDGSGSATSYAHLPPLSPAGATAVYGLNSPYMTDPSAFTTGIPGLAALYLAELRRRQPYGPYHLGGWSAGGIAAYEAAQQLFAAGERVATLVLFDSPNPVALPALPPRLHEFFADVGLLGTASGGGGEKKAADVPKWLVPHFGATIRALAAYRPVPVPRGVEPPRALAIWARWGVCRRPGVDARPERLPDEPRSMTWLLDNRTDFGGNGWEGLLGGVVETRVVDANHFTMMRDVEQLQEIARFVREFLAQ